MWYFVMAIGLYICVYTVSYGIWEWQKGNKSAAVVICILSVSSLIVPIFKIWA